MGEAPCGNDVLQRMAGWRDCRSHISNGGKLWLVDYGNFGNDLVRSSSFHALFPAQVLNHLTIFYETFSITSFHPGFSRCKRNDQSKLRSSAVRHWTYQLNRPSNLHHPALNDREP